MRARIAVTLAAAAALAAGCGSSGSDDDGTATAGTAPAAAPAASAGGLEVGDPRPVAGRRSGGRLVATVTVAGRAPGGTKVVVDARCRRDECTGAATAAADTGAFSTRVRIETDPASGTGFVDVRAGDQDSTVLVTLKTPRAKAPGRPQPRREPAERPSDDEDLREQLDALEDLEEDTVVPQPVPRDTGSAGPRLPRRLHLVGDSLAVGTAAPLRANLPGWRITTDAEENRPLAAGMARPLPSGARPSVIAYSLFTNDDPGSTAALEAAVRESLTRVPARGCVVWATIVRPPVGARGYAQANRLLRRLAAASGGRIILADWSRATAAQPDWLADDGVHGTSTGYTGRAALYADAAKECLD